MHRKWWSKCSAGGPTRHPIAPCLHQTYPMIPSAACINAVKQNPTVSPKPMLALLSMCLSAPGATHHGKHIPAEVIFAMFCYVLLCFAMFCYVLVTWYRHWKLSIPVAKVSTFAPPFGPKTHQQTQHDAFRNEGFSKSFPGPIGCTIEVGHPVGDMS